jgi:hypothetical protein
MGITLKDLIECFKGNHKALKREVNDKNLKGFTFLFKVEITEDNDEVEYFLTDGKNLYNYYESTPMPCMLQTNLEWFDYPEIEEQMKNYYRLKKLSHSCFND